MEDSGGLQPWQIFTAMAIGFWSISVYFDHILMTLVFSIAFGVLAEVVTKYIYGQKISFSPKKENLNTSSGCVPNLSEMARHEAKRIAEGETGDMEEKLNRNEMIWREADRDIAEEEEGGQEHSIYQEEIEVDDEEACPPPLPAKDYFTATAEDTMEEVSKRLSQHLSENEMEATFPASSDTAPASSDTAPASSDTAPVSSDTAPVSSDTASASSDTAPFSSDTAPVSSGTTPTISFTAPATYTPDLLEDEPSEDPVNHSDNFNEEIIRHVSEGHCSITSSGRSEMETNNTSNPHTENIRSMSEIQADQDDIESGDENGDDGEESPVLADTSEEEVEEENESGEYQAAEKLVEVIGGIEDDDGGDEGEGDDGVTDEMIDQEIEKMAKTHNLGGSFSSDSDENDDRDKMNNANSAGTNQLIDFDDDAKEKKIYAPDSSSDEEISDKKDDDGEDTDDEDLMGGGVTESVVSGKGGGEKVQITADSNPAQKESPGGTVELDSNPEKESPVGTAEPDSNPAEKESASGVAKPLEEDEDLSGIDLTDPELEMAAAKIQSVFKGFQRKKKQEDPNKI